MNWLDRFLLRISLIVATYRAHRAASARARSTAPRCPACGGTTCREVEVRIIDDATQDVARRP